jgi:hypothetical protein
MGWIRNTLIALTLSVAIANCTPPKDSPQEVKKQRKFCKDQREITSKAGKPLKFKDHYFFTLKGDYCKDNSVYNLRRDISELQKIEHKFIKYHCFQARAEAKKSALDNNNMPAYRLLLNRNWCRGTKYEVQRDIRSLERNLAPKQ